jgi:hypothetical protein
MIAITEQMLETAYEVFSTKDQDIEQLLALGMNENSAKMTIAWFNNLFSGKPNKRTGSAMQIRWILNKLYEENNFERLAFSLESLNEYLDYYDKKPMVKTRQTVKEFWILLEAHYSTKSRGELRV